MRNLMKRSLALTFVAALLCSLAIANAAMPESEIMPLYNFIERTSCTIDIYGTEAVMTASVRADADKCQIKMTLQMYDGSTWDDVVSWTSSKSASEYEVERSYDIDPDESYRVKVTFKVWNGTSTETVTKTATP